MSKTICVFLDDYTEEALYRIMAVNQCSISDAVIMALGSMSVVEFPSMNKEPDPLLRIKQVIDDSHGLWDSLDHWCEDRCIIKSRLRYLMLRIANGGTVCGFGNARNKWRDKQDGRQFKTHTAWIAHCLKTDLGIDII